MKTVADGAAEELLLTKADYVALAGFRHGVRRYLAFAEAGARTVGLTTSTSKRMMARSSARNWTRPGERKYCGSMSRYSPGR